MIIRSVSFNSSVNLIDHAALPFDSSLAGQQGSADNALTLGRFKHVHCNFSIDRRC